MFLIFLLYKVCLLLKPQGIFSYYKKRFAKQKFTYKYFVLIIIFVSPTSTGIRVSRQVDFYYEFHRSLLTESIVLIT